jgi:hypothetical protein
LTLGRADGIGRDLGIRGRDRGADRCRACVNRGSGTGVLRQLRVSYAGKVTLAARLVAGRLSTTVSAALSPAMGEVELYLQCPAGE